jgi:DNA-binding CsgD family transcriptional regulator
VSSIHAALDDFREAAAQPARWPQALDSLCLALHSDAANVVLAPTAPERVVSSSNVASFIREYFRSPIPDPRERRVSPGPTEGFMPDYAYFSQGEIAQSPYYQEFLIPRGFGWNATATLQGSLMISLRRGIHRGPYDGHELSDLDRALPALRRVSRVASLAWKSGFTGQLAAFERVGRGALVMNARGRVIETNALVAFGDGVDIVEGCLRAPRTVDQLRLERFLTAVLTSAVESPPWSTTLALPRPSGRRPLLLDGVSCGEALRSLHSDAAALVLVTDLDRSVQVSEDLLTMLFGLTATENKVAREMANGGSVREAAQRLGISEAHARQRVKSIFQKTQTSRQSELIALLAKLEDRAARHRS